MAMPAVRALKAGGALSFRKVRIGYAVRRMTDGGKPGVTNVDAEARSSISATIAQYLLPCHTASLGVSRMPATAIAGQPLALFLSGIMSDMNNACLRVLLLITLFDIIVCGLPGHGISCEV